MSGNDSDLKNKVTDVLNEAGILVLGTQVLLGFQFQALFYPGFARLPPVSQWANFVSLILELGALGLLLVPAPYHRIVEDGDDSTRLQHLTSRMIALALPLLAGSLGLNVALVSARTIGNEAAIATGLVSLVAALTMWIVMGTIKRGRLRPPTLRNARRRHSVRRYGRF